MFIKSAVHTQSPKTNGAVFLNKHVITKVDVWPHFLILLIFNYWSLGIRSLTDQYEVTGAGADDNLAQEAVMHNRTPWVL